MRQMISPTPALPKREGSPTPSLPQGEGGANKLSRLPKSRRYNTTPSILGRVGVGLPSILGRVGVGPLSLWGRVGVGLLLSISQNFIL